MLNLKTLATLAIFFIFPLTAYGQQDAVDLTREYRIVIQHGLTELGHDPGTIDGSFGNNTRAAIWDWQNNGEGTATGYLSEAEAEQLTEAGLRKMVSLGLDPLNPEQPAANPFRAAPDGGRDEDTGPSPVPADERVIWFFDTDLCKTTTEGDEFGRCWAELTNIPGCHIYTESKYYKFTMIFWSGICGVGVAQGRGTLTLSTEEEELSYKGEYMNGKQEGKWTYRVDDKTGDLISSGEEYYVDGKKHGMRIYRSSNGNILETPYVDGTIHGTRIFRFSDGDIAETPYVDGTIHGTEIYRFSDGDIAETPYVDGERQ